MGDDELLPLPAELVGLRGVELARAALARHRPEQPSTAPRRAWEPPLVSQSTPPLKSPLSGPSTAFIATPDPEWTPHDALTPAYVHGHWADGTPMPDFEDSLEEDR